MDGIDATFGVLSDTSPGAVVGWNAPQLQTHATMAEVPAATPYAAPDPVVWPEEVAAILAVVPRAQRNGAQWSVPLLLETARGGGITHPRRIAYVLATAQHAARFGAQLVETGSSIGDESDGFFDRYEPATVLGTARGNTQRGDGARFRGRGFVHVSGRADYATWSQRLGLPEQFVNGETVPYFIAFPEAMARPNVAAQTLVRGMRDGIFTGVALGSYVNDKKTDYYNARRVIAGSLQARDVAARDIAVAALAYQTAIEAVHAARHRTHMQDAAHRRTGTPRNFVAEVQDAVEQLAVRGEILAFPTQVLDWSGEARQGKFVQLDERTCALHIGRGLYVRLDIQRDLNGIVPPEGRNVALKRSGEVRPASRNGMPEFWR